MVLPIEFLLVFRFALLKIPRVPVVFLNTQHLFDATEESFLFERHRPLRGECQVFADGTRDLHSLCTKLVLRRQRQLFEMIRYDLIEISARLRDLSHRNVQTNRVVRDGRIRR